MSTRITQTRINDACQISSGNPQFQRFKIEKLIKDMNTLHGTKIQLYDKNGRPRPLSELCGDIYSYIPDTSVCFLRGNKVPNVKDVARHAEDMNKKFGSTIVYHIDPMNPRSGYRTIPEICEQMHDVASHVRRRLDDDLDGVRRKLKSHIDELKGLESVFNGGLTTLPAALNATLSVPTTSISISALTGDLETKYKATMEQIDAMKEAEEVAIKELQERAVRQEISRPEFEVRLDVLNRANIGIVDDLFRKLPIQISGNRENDYKNLVEFYMNLKNKARNGDQYARKLYKENRDAFKILKHGFSPLNMTVDQIVKNANDVNINIRNLLN